MNYRHTTDHHEHQDYHQHLRCTHVSRFLHQAVLKRVPVVSQNTLAESWLEQKMDTFLTMFTILVKLPWDCATGCFGDFAEISLFWTVCMMGVHPVTGASCQATWSQENCTNSRRSCARYGRGEQKEAPIQAQTASNSCCSRDWYQRPASRVCNRPLQLFHFKIFVFWLSRM